MRKDRHSKKSQFPQKSNASVNTVLKLQTHISSMQLNSLAPEALETILFQNSCLAF
jgi:hypothetical protein